MRGYIEPSLGVNPGGGFQFVGGQKARPPYVLWQYLPETIVGKGFEDFCLA